MQIKSEEIGRISYGVLDNIEPGLGLYSLPPKSDKDIYFDIESNTLLTKLPLHYLWGAAHEDNQEGFNCWWAHSELEMKQAFEDFIDWVFERWSLDKDMHIYHYGQYEITALRTLMGHFGSREEKVDQLLRNEVFVDLIRVVKQSLCVGSKGYGLKEIEPLYREDRIGEVSSGLDSTVTYEVWSADRGDTRDHTNSDLLKEIWDYNKDDCISLIRLSDFLREVQLEKGFTYSSVSATETGTEEEKDTSETIKELIDNLQNKENKPHAKILANLCLFHLREYKPKAWRMYDRFESTDQDLVNDLDCLADLLATGKIEALEKPSRSCVYEYSFDPNQESKIKTGDWLINKADGPRSKRFEIYALDLKEGLLKIKSTSELPNHLTLIPRDQYFGGPIQDSIQKIASEYLEGNELNPCLENFLSRKRPNFKKDHDEDLSSWGKNTLDSAIRVATELDGGYFCMQGPPGTGKTHVGSRLISALVKSGARIGISSNSHKAINNLLEKVISTMDQDKVEGEIVRIHDLKDHEDEPLYEDSRINRFRNIRESVISEDTNIIAGTAWVFSNDKMNNQLDYLFIDEAGQVSLANLVGMSHSTKNLILMGDQMQIRTTNTRRSSRRGWLFLARIPFGRPAHHT